MGNYDAVVGCRSRFRDRWAMRIPVPRSPSHMTMKAISTNVHNTMISANPSSRR
jgi:hypothetical protein